MGLGSHTVSLTHCISSHPYDTSDMGHRRSNRKDTSPDCTVTTHGHNPCYEACNVKLNKAQYKKQCQFMKIGRYSQSSGYRKVHALTYIIRPTRIKLQLQN